MKIDRISTPPPMSFKEFMEAQDLTLEISDNSINYTVKIKNNEGSFATLFIGLDICATSVDEDEAIRDLARDISDNILFFKPDIQVPVPILKETL